MACAGIQRYALYTAQSMAGEEDVADARAASLVGGYLFLFRSAAFDRFMLPRSSDSLPMLRGLRHAHHRTSSGVLRLHFRLVPRRKCGRLSEPTETVVLHSVRFYVYARSFRFAALARHPARSPDAPSGVRLLRFRIDRGFVDDYYLHCRRYEESVVYTESRK